MMSLSDVIKADVSSENLARRFEAVARLDRQCKEWRAWAVLWFTLSIVLGTALFLEIYEHAL